MDGIIWIENNGLMGTGLYFSVPFKEEGKSKILNNNYLNPRIAI
jgi:hypothetical protein